MVTIIAIITATTVACRIHNNNNPQRHSFGVPVDTMVVNHEWLRLVAVDDASSWRGMVNIVRWLHPWILGRAPWSITANLNPRWRDPSSWWLRTVETRLWIDRREYHNDWQAGHDGVLSRSGCTLWALIIGQPFRRWLTSERSGEKTPIFEGNLPGIHDKADQDLPLCWQYSIDKT